MSLDVAALRRACRCDPFFPHRPGASVNLSQRTDLFRNSAVPYVAGKDLRVEESGLLRIDLDKPGFPKLRYEECTVVILAERQRSYGWYRSRRDGRASFLLRCCYAAPVTIRPIELL